MRWRIDTVIATARIHALESVLGTEVVGERLALAYRELIRSEAQLGETLARRGMRVGATLADQWTTLDEYLGLYARGLSPAGMVVFGGRPDDGSRATGIPFTGGPEARDILGLEAPGQARSPSGEAFWRAVNAARAKAQDAPVESLFGSVHLTHAQPFDFAPEPEVREASAQHVLRILGAARPQAAVCIGADALATVGRALRNSDLVSLASSGRERAWTERWPAGTRLSAYPYAEVPIDQPFRLRVVPVPSLVGTSAASGEQALADALSYVLA